MSTPTPPQNPMDNPLIRILLEQGLQSLKDSSIKKGESVFEKARTSAKDFDLNQVIKIATDTLGKVIPQNDKESVAEEPTKPKASKAKEPAEKPVVPEPVAPTPSVKKAEAFTESQTTEVNKNIDSIYDVSVGLSTHDRDALVSSVMNLIRIFSPEDRSQEQVRLVARLYGNKEI